MLAVVIAVGCGGDGANPTGKVVGAFAVPTVVEPYPPESWMAKIQPSARGSAIDLTCLDANGDRRLSGADAADLAGLDIPIASGGPCLPPGTRREWFAEDVGATTCAAPDSRELLLVVIGGGGTDLFDREQGVSAGLIDIANGVRAGAVETGVSASVTLTTAAIDAADLPQMRMEQWLAHDLQRRLAVAPCLRAVIVGHSHGAVVVTSVLAALEAAYEDRVFGVLLDRSLLYYDHEAAELPVRAAVLNVFQTNEGWHGEALLTTNVINIDASSEVAPQEPRDGPLPIVAVRHSTLDDAAGVQRIVVDHVMTWLGEP